VRSHELPSNVSTLRDAHSIVSCTESFSVERQAEHALAAAAAAQRGLVLYEWLELSAASLSRAT